MENEYPFTQSEYAKIIGVTKECLRTRRRTGKLVGEYKVIENQYFYKRPRPNQQSTTLVKPPARRRKRGQHYQSLLGSAVTHYPHFKMKQHNELKMIAKLQRSVSQEDVELIPAAIHHIRQERQKELERFRQEQQQRNTLYKPGTFRSYGQGIYNCKKQPYRWVDWDTFRSNGKSKKKYQYYD